MNAEQEATVAPLLTTLLERKRIHTSCLAELGTTLLAIVHLLKLHGWQLEVSDIDQWDIIPLNQEPREWKRDGVQI